MRPCRSDTEIWNTPSAPYLFSGAFGPRPRIFRYEILTRYSASGVATTIGCGIAIDWPRAPVTASSSARLSSKVAHAFATPGKYRSRRPSRTGLGNKSRIHTSSSAHTSELRELPVAPVSTHTLTTERSQLPQRLVTTPPIACRPHHASQTPLSTTRSDLNPRSARGFLHASNHSSHKY